MHSQGETNVTVGAGSLPNVEAMTTNANKGNSARFIAPAHITLWLLCEATSEIDTSFLTASEFLLASARIFRLNEVPWTYLLKIYRKRSQFANKSIIFNGAFPLFCDVHLKGQPVLPPPDATSRIRQERNFPRPLELVGHG